RYCALEIFRPTPPSGKPPTVWTGRPGTRPEIARFKEREGALEVPILASELEGSMQSRTQAAAIVAMLVMALSSPAWAEICPSGYTLHASVCHPNSTQGPQLTPFTSTPKIAPCPAGYKLSEGGCHPNG